MATTLCDKEFHDAKTLESFELHLTVPTEVLEE